MSEPPIDLVLLWHHHQPDYRRADDHRAMLPWVRLHASKDYLDMALHVERHPGVRVTFNFVPSLIDQLEGAERGEPDVLFELLARPVASLGPEERVQVARQCAMGPPHALERWAPYRVLAGRTRRPSGGLALGDRELLELEVWFLLAWIDPMFEPEPAVRQALASIGGFTAAHRDELLALHARLLAEVLPAYRRLAERGQVELSASPYYHPILPLLIDPRSARRARPELPLPAETWTAREDARTQILRALERNERAFGARPSGMWPSEGSVSPETAELAAAAGIRWLASDEGVLWASLPGRGSARSALYRPWVLETAAGEMALFFRDRELSDRVGFVYQRWNPDDAVNDFLGRLRRIARERVAEGGTEPPVVSVILDGENCWEHFVEDGRRFLDGLYAALEAAPDIRTRTPSEVLASGAAPGRLATLHSGSWIDADFHVWIGHPEKNRAWDALARTRRTLVDANATPESRPESWEALYRAEGSDWFWWFGDDHYTADKALFDELFRSHLATAYEAAELAPPANLGVPIASPHGLGSDHVRPSAFVRPKIDGVLSQFYEWHGAGLHRFAGGGGSMHRAEGRVRDAYYGFDLEHLFLRLDFTTAAPPGPATDLRVELVAPRTISVVIAGLERGSPPVTILEVGGTSRELAGAECRIGEVLELALPFATLGLMPGAVVELVLQLVESSHPVETYPTDQTVRFTVPDAGFEAENWSA